MSRKITLVPYFTFLLVCLISLNALAFDEGCTAIDPEISKANNLKTNINYAFVPDIEVTGNGIVIMRGDNSPSIADNTDFGITGVGTTITKEFVIENTGTTDLIINGIGTDDSNFVVNADPQPFAIAAGETNTFTVDFTPDALGPDSAFLFISNSTDSPPFIAFTFAISAEAVEVEDFYDSDNDGITDDMDDDDDNDGISDADEEAACSSTGSVSNAKLFEETFGTGTDRAEINITNNATTTYSYNDGVNSPPKPDVPFRGGPENLWDGQYAVISQASNSDGLDDTPPDLSYWAEGFWYTGGDHTGDTDGRMAVFNAEFDPGTFYSAEITNTFANTPFTFSFWALNLYTTTSQEPEEVSPSIIVQFRDSDDNVLTNQLTGLPAEIVTGLLPLSVNGDPAASWNEFSEEIVLDVSDFYVVFINDGEGGEGNDLALDDIVLSQTQCDSDGDGIANVYDLDSDNDGIPDAVEASLAGAALSGGIGVFTTSSGGWADTNDNGMIDALESEPVLDTDNDGVPNFLDLDSDNDALFDVDESGSLNSNDANFVNGDGDTSGNGYGDGIESETFRERNLGNNILEGFGDGILDIFDYNTGDDFTAYGNNGQGSSPYYTIDSDGDMLPDYMDPTNNSTGINDIDTSIFYATLPNTDGVLDDTTDADGDGIVASRDTDDTVFGSPRDYSDFGDSFALYFDGKNDYVEDTNVLTSGDATLMAFFKTDGTNADGGQQYLIGQDDIYIRLNPTSTSVIVNVEGETIKTFSPIPANIWTHVTLTTSAANGTVLYINGEEIGSLENGGVTSTSNFFIGRAAFVDDFYFKGEMDEVKVFNTALTAEQIRTMVYQELNDSTGFNQGLVTPQDIPGLPGGNLVRYFKMDDYNDAVLTNQVALGDTSAQMYNFKDVMFQTAPLPYVTANDGNWTDTATWEHGDVWDIMDKEDNPESASIVEIKHNIILDGTYETQHMTGLIVDAGKELTVSDDKGLFNSFYLEVNGLIDLEGEAQLIQTEGSVLQATSAGSVEIDQQGTSNLYKYNLWSSPVGITGAATNNAPVTVPGVINNVGFITSGTDGTASPTAVADYWIWTFPDTDATPEFPDWVHTRSTGLVEAGQGFTMKGPGTAGPTQNYVFNGKPHNGDIQLSITAGNDYLIGNPYLSAIDAQEFIKDNISVADGGTNTANVINGALYFWEHFSDDSHNTADYEGGYGVYTLIGATVPMTTDENINIDGDLESEKGAPLQYIPVGQGFFVSALIDDSLGPIDPGIAPVGGQITFKNSQRVFQRESDGESVFFKPGDDKKTAASADVVVDARQKIRLKFDSPTGYHRELLVGTDENASDSFDLGYDAPLIEQNLEDMYWINDNISLVIQGVSNFDLAQVLPLGIKVSEEGLANFEIAELENIESDIDIYLHDKLLNVFHDLRASNYEIVMEPGIFLDRFEITFQESQTLDVDDLDNTALLQAFVSNKNRSIVLHNPALETIESIQLYNTLGQIVFSYNERINTKYFELKVPRIAQGNYILKVAAGESSVSKMVLIN